MDMEDGIQLLSIVMSGPYDGILPRVTPLQELVSRHITFDEFRIMNCSSQRIWFLLEELSEASSRFRLREAFHLCSTFEL